MKFLKKILLKSKNQMNHCKQALNLSLFAVDAFHAMASFWHAVFLENHAQ